MKERPILFSAPMVRAILDGRKTQTRRKIKPGDWSVEAHTMETDWPYLPHYLTDGAAVPVKCPYGNPGDRLWVRETWANERDGTGCPDDTGILYRATDPGWDDEDTGLRWRPSIFMPRRASRITLEITDVRVQRLQDISDDDSRAEGYDRSHAFPREWFALLWESINGTGSWAANPWVWAITFRKLGADQ
jgi:hypothetical protein